MEARVNVRGRCLSGMLVAAAVATLLAPAQPRGGEAGAGGATILDEFSFWRCHYTYLPEVIRERSGGLETIRELPAAWGSEAFTVAMPVSSPPPAGWTGVDFDDGAWIRQPGPFGSLIASRAGAERNAHPPLRLICLRGRFEVREPERAGPLRLSATYHGGMVVHLNGKEVARRHMPEGEIRADTPAEVYPDEACVDGNGVLRAFGAEQRDRRVKDLEIPAALLRKGVNVLGVELHRPPTPAIWNTAKSSRPNYSRDYWAMVGLWDLELAAAAGSAAVVPNVSRPEGICVRTANVLIDLHDRDYPDPKEPLCPLVLVGARNGRFSGQIVVSAPGALRGCSAAASDLVQREGGGRIPKSSLQVRYALPDGIPNQWQGPLKKDDSKSFRGHYRGGEGGKRPGAGPGPAPNRFDGLEEAPLPEVPAGADGGATQPIWVTVAVPREAAGGTYQGSVSVTVNGSPPVAVPLEMRVAEYTLPEARDFTSLLNIVHSPDSVAARYSAKLWSEEHWRLEEKALRLLGQSGARALYLHLICGTHHGNEQSMVRWVTKGGGGYDHDFSIVERYLDLAAKHLNRRRPLVCFYVYDPINAYGRADQCIPLQVSVLDPKTGQVGTMDAPGWDAPGSAGFWKPVFEGLRQRCAARGLEKGMAVGMAGQGDPGKAAMGVLNELIPEAGWVRVEHGYKAQTGGKPCADAATAYNIPGDLLCTPHKRFQGWKDTTRTITFFPRGRRVGLHDYYPAATFRLFAEALQCTGFQGFSWLGADFWDLGEASGKSSGGRSGARTLLKTNWGQLAIGATGGSWNERESGFLAPGRDGPIATARYEMLCEGLQETEARIFLEGALSDPERSKRMGQDLSARCQALLDDRVRAMIMGLGTITDRTGKYQLADRTIEDKNLWYASTAAERSAELYAMAAAAAKALGEP